MPDPSSGPPLIRIEEPSLTAKGFTKSGLQHFVKTVQDYAQQLLSRSIHFGDVDKADGMPAEVTHDHVRASAHSIAATFGTKSPPTWLIITQVIEYIATAAAGVGGGHLDKSSGIVTFAIGISIAVILVVVRLTKGKGE